MQNATHYCTGGQLYSVQVYSEVKAALLKVLGCTRINAKIKECCNKHAKLESTLNLKFTGVKLLDEQLK
jgi:hypothetical protein